MKRNRFFLASLTILIPIAVPLSVDAQVSVGTVFTYQGRLTDGGSPADGLYDLQFTLFDSTGFAIGGPDVVNDVPVANGLFKVDLDFGSVFTGQAASLEIGVRPGASTSDFMILSPRQPLTPTPYALYALNSAGGGGSLWQSFGSDIYYTAGNVGVGEMEPDEKLDVWGTVQMTGFQLSTSPMAGYVLTSDASGHGTWQPGGGGGGGYWTADAEGINYQAGNVGIGTQSELASGLNIEDGGLHAIRAHNTNAGSQSFALYAEADSTLARTIFADATATSGQTVGVFGRANSPDGFGVFGDDNADTGSGTGVWGRSSSPTGRGGYFQTESSQGYGVYAEAVSGSTGWAGYFIGRGYFSNNVGIGTASPGSPLTVAGIVESISGGFKFPDGTIQTTAGGGGGGESLWLQNGSEIYYDTDNVGVGVSDPQATLHVAGGNWDVASTEGDFKIGNSSYRLKMGVGLSGGELGESRIFAGGPTSKLILGANGQERLTLTGTQTEIAGTLEMDGFKLTNAPTAGYVLTSDEFGNGTWQEPTGGTGGSFDLPYDGIVTSSSAAFSILNMGTGHAIVGWSSGHGGSFRSSMVDGYGVKGEAVASSGNDTTGGWFESSSTYGKGVYGLATGYHATGIKAEASGDEATALSGYATGTSGVGVSAKTESTSEAALVAKNYVGGPIIQAKNSASNVVFEIVSDGTTSVDVLHITGGADLAERFDVAEESAAPGMVVEIDPDHPGKMRIARGAYNRRVAGVISGANKLSVGMVLGDMQDVGNALPIALSGRVWVHCDATQHAIEPGDMLTTADRPGYAMAVTDFDRAHGTVIGKAMSELARGETGMVLVLVNLQ